MPSSSSYKDTEERLNQRVSKTRWFEHIIARAGKVLKLTCRVALLAGIQCVLAEEESILDLATVLSICDTSDCDDEQLVIGPGFKSRWFKELSS